MKVIKYILLFFFIFSSQLSAKNFEVSYLKENTHYKNVDKVIFKDFTSIKGNYTFGKKKHVWLKVKITNTKKSTENNYLALSNLQVLEDVHFYTVQDNKVLKKDTRWNKYTNPDTSHRIGKALIYSNTLKPGQSIEVFIYITAKSHIFYEIYNGTLTEVMSQITQSTTLLLFLTGILSALGIYYLFLYFQTPHKEYMYYILFVFSIILQGFYIYGGYAHYFNYFGLASLSNVFIYMIPLWTILFLKMIYKKEERFQKYNKILNVVIFTLIFMIIIYLLGKTPYVQFAIIKYVPIIYLGATIITMVIAILLYKNKLPLSGLFIIGYSANFIGSAISILFFMGLTPYTILISHANMVGGALEAILFSLLLTAKIKDIYIQKDKAIQENNKKEKILQQQSRLAQMGEMISMIAHQWRQPLGSINSAAIAMNLKINIFQSKEKHNQETIELLEFLSNKITNISNYVLFLSTTIDDFRNFFRPDKQKELTSVEALINSSLDIVKSTLQTKKIKVITEFTKDTTLELYKNEIIQVILNIIKNSEDNFSEKQTKEPFIKLTTRVQDGYCIIEISDNGGGIDETIIDQIFDPYFSTKNEKNGTGMGLYISKIIVEDHNKGKLNVSNTKLGVCFSIEFKT